MDSGRVSFRPAPPEVLPASQYLQDRLSERRAKNTRPKRSRQSDFGPRRGRDDDIFLEEAEHSRHAPARLHDGSPLAAGSTLGSDAGRSGYSKRHSIGAKDLDGQLDRLNKQNFALKLELDHRRETALKMQEQLESMLAQVERAEQLEEEHAELLRINTQLVEELEKRDKAVEEAMDIICDLEDTVADMDEGHSNTRPSTANADSGYAGTETHGTQASSPQEPSRIPKLNVVARHPPPSASAATRKLHTMVDGQDSTRSKRQLSVLSQRMPSTHALRSVYQANAQNLQSVRSFNSLVSKRDSKVEEEDAALESPRMSVLSECSFPSLYSPHKKISPERYAWEAPEDGVSPESVPAHFRQDSINRVSRWIGDSVAETPSRSNGVSSPLSQRTARGAPPPSTPLSSDQAHFLSLNNALSSTSTINGRPPSLLQPVAYTKPHPATAANQQALHACQARPVSINVPVFGDLLLPPTPDSASTHILRASCSGIASQQNDSEATPTTVARGDTLEPGAHTRPRRMRLSAELSRSYRDHQHYHENGYGKMGPESSSEDEDYDDHLGAGGDREYDGFPDGNSILMGTPSRFLKHGKRTVAEQLFLDGDDISPPDTARSPLRRRQSSTETTVNTAVNSRKPSLGRAETSPSFLGTLGRMVTNTSKSTVDTVTSPRSHYSGSSGNRTVMQAENERNRSTSPDVPRSHLRPAAARSSLGQRTQQLLRRLSNSQQPERSEPPPPQSPKEKSPLPTLTSTPSAAYSFPAPSRESRRPSTGGEPKQTSSLPQRVSMGGSQSRRPSLQARTQTEPARPVSVVAAGSGASERLNGSKRGDSVQRISNGAETVLEREGEGRGGTTRRRGSIREAVGGGRRPWR